MARIPAWADRHAAERNSPARPRADAASLSGYGVGVGAALILGCSDTERIGSRASERRGSRSPVLPSDRALARQAGGDAGAAAYGSVPSLPVVRGTGGPTLAPDIFGRALMDWARGGTEPEIIERDDGFTDVGGGHEFYLAQFRHWPSSERQAIRYARGRVADIGCGAGRVALHLQGRGFDVVGLDQSPLAIRAARLRGVEQARCTSLDSLAPEIGSFDTIVLFGNNFGIFGTPQRLRRELTRWARASPPGARILAESTSPYFGGAPAVDRSFYHQNRLRGRLSGSVTLRNRYGDAVGPWFRWLFVSRNEMRTLLRGTGWRPTRILGGPPSEPYVAVLEKD